MMGSLSKWAWRSALPTIALVGLTASATAQDDLALADAAEASPVAEAATSVELVSYHGAEGRFTERMAELDADTRRFLSLREEEERTKLVSGYDQLIETLAQMEDDNRVLTRERMERFLTDYPNEAYASHVRFRLADLYFVDAKKAWLQAMGEYSVLESQLMDEERWDEIPPQPMMDLTPSIRLYARIIADNEHLPNDEQYSHLDGAYYMLGFCYNEPSSGQKSEDGARGAFLDLIRVKPESELVDAARLFLGNIHFDHNEFDEAIAQYRMVFDRGPEGLYYMEALYQLAWTWFKLAGPDTPENYDKAMALFTKVLDLGVLGMEETGRESDYAPDALKYMAISFSDISDFPGAESTALAVAQDRFEGHPGATYVWDVYNELGDVLTQQARFSEAIEVYQYMQEAWPLRPENPDLMYKVATLLASGGPGVADFDAAAAAIVDLTERYNDGTAWWDANRSNPDALGVARKFIEDSLADVAVDYHLRAQASGDPADYLAAAAKYREYLEKFPISDDFYQKQAYLADSLFQAHAYDDALAEYESLIRSGDHHAYRDLSIVRAADASRLRMESAVENAPDDVFDADAMAVAESVQAFRWMVPAAGFVDHTIETPDGPLPVYALSDWHQAFLDKTARAVEHTFVAPPADVEDVRDLREMANTRRPKLQYLMAQMLYVHNRFDEAEPLLLAVIQDSHDSLEASFAAGLHVNMHLVQGHLAKVRELAKQYRINPPGPPEVFDAKAEEFGTLEEQVAFEQCTLTIEEDRAGAADCFFAFYTEFPASKYRADALYSVGNNYDIVGQKEKAIEWFERYVAEYPEDPRSRNLFFRIAATYEATLELPQAVSYYEQIIANFPDDPNSPDALYNASSLKIGLGDYAGAATGFETYGVNYPDRPDAEKVYWYAAAQREELGTAAAKRFYEKYLRRYQLQNPDHALEAKQRLAEIFAEAGDQRRAERLLDEVDADFRAVIADGVEVGANGRHYAAAAAFRKIQADFEAFTAAELTQDDERDLALLQDELPLQLDAFETEATQYVATYGDFEYSTAALLRIGQAYDDYASLFSDLQPDPSWNQDLQDAFYEIVDTQIMPIADTVQAKGISRLERVIDFAQEKQRHSEYVTEALDALNRIDPRAYPAQKVEIRGEVDASGAHIAQPVRAEPAVAEDEGVSP